MRQYREIDGHGKFIALKSTRSTKARLQSLGFSF